MNGLYQGINVREAVKNSLNELHNNFLHMVRHPLYNRIGIGINALQLLVSSFYGALIFASLLFKGHSIIYASIPLIILLGVSINLFYQSIKLYK